MKKYLLLLIAVVVFFHPTASHADVTAYRALRDAKPDGRVVKVTNLTIERDAYKITFRSGAFHYLAPVDGRTFGAVFIGDGQFVLTPATEGERRHIGIVQGDPNMEVLTDSFDSLVLLFTDNTSKEIEAHRSVETAAPDPKALSLYADYLERQKRKFQLNLHLRILEDLLDKPGSRAGVFLAEVDGKKTGQALIAIDPLGVGNLAAEFGFAGGEETAFLSIDQQNGGLWYLSALKTEAVEGKGRALHPLVHAIHYDVETTIASNLGIEGTTKIQLRPLMSGVRVVPIQILPKLRLKDASVTIGGKSAHAEIIQEEVDLGAFKRLFNAEVSDSNAAIVLPEDLPVDADSEITLHYEGKDVLFEVAPESYSVRGRESWYPNVGTFTDLASYSMTYHYPKKLTLVSSGKMIEQTDGVKEKTSKWQSDRPLRVIGFNYGKFDKITEHDAPSGLTIDVYTNQEFRKMARDTMADAQNAARVATAFFGKAPYPQVSVTQQAEWNFGQSWPSLVFLPTLAFTTSTERVEMTGDQKPTTVFGINEFAETVGWHEMSHQWWGHLVGWESYRDQWLSEGFAEFTAALVMEVTEGDKKYDDLWERKRQNILQKQGGTLSNNDGGPISMGFRLSTKASPGAAQSIIYEKGAYVLHMLRMALRDFSKKNPDQTFMAMMHDFVTSYSEKNPSTDDFQRIVEKYMTAPMNAARNGKMDYFFKQWVEGTDIPKLKSDLHIDLVEGTKYRLSGSVSQEGVPNDFLTVVPLYIEYPDGGNARIGFVRLAGTTPQPVKGELQLAQKPKRLVVNAEHDVLTR